MTVTSDEKVIRSEGGMSSSSPGAGGSGGSPGAGETGPGTPRSSQPSQGERAGRSSLSERVGFFEQVWKSRQRSRSRSKESSRLSTSASEGTVVRRERSATRVETAYHGKRTDARDRSSEDPKRHRIPRASLSPSPITVNAEEDLDAEEVRQRIRKRSGSGKRNMDRRTSLEQSLERERRRSREEGERERKRSRDEAVRRSSSRTREGSLSGQPEIGDDIPSQRTASVKRSLSGRSSYSTTRALSFRVSPAKQPTEEARDVRSPERDPSVSITKHIQTKVGQQRHSMTSYERPPPLPERPPRANRTSEPAIYSGVLTGEREKTPTYMQSTASSLARSTSRGSDYGQVNWDIGEECEVMPK